MYFATEIEPQQIQESCKLNFEGIILRILVLLKDRNPSKWKTNQVQKHIYSTETPQNLPLRLQEETSLLTVRQRRRSGGDFFKYPE